MGLNGDFERQLRKAVQDGLRDVAKDYQKMLDSLGRRYRGQSLSTIKPALQREWKRVGGGRLTEPDLTEYATAISEGTPIKMRVGK